MGESNKLECHTCRRRRTYKFFPSLQSMTANLEWLKKINIYESILKILLGTPTVEYEKIISFTIYNA